ncbi:MAG: hypothetical protein R3217_05835 [Gammaproteobacteria bacterium]|nr:hypothetical protein [Gammaproteobacteria bacterium]
MRVLFASEYNSCRSQMAEAIFNLLSAEGSEAFSAGFEPVGYVDAYAIAVMQELGVDITYNQSKGLEDLPAIEFDVVVAINWPEPEVLAKGRMQLDWDLSDPSGMGVEECRSIRNELRSRIERLISAPLPVS